MPVTKHIFAILITTLSLNSTCCLAQQAITGKAKNTGHTGPGFKTLDAKILQWQQELHIPNVGVGLIENGVIVKSQVYGNDHQGKPASSNMLFEVASVTKVVFTTLVLKLVQEGKWNLDEPLYNYYVDPDVASSPYAKEITTRHVLSHQSGFDNWRWMNPSGKLVFNFEPGKKFNYSGEGMEYLRLAIEHKFHKSLTRLSDSLLFKPLHMYNTSHEWDGKKDFVRYVGMYDSEGKEIVKTDYSVQASAAAGLTTTVDDLSKFAVEILKGAHLSKSLYSEMVKPQVEINPNLQQGLGWRIVSGLSNNEYALEHAGNDPGVASIIVLLPKSKRGIVVLTNGDNGLIMCNNIVRAAFQDGPLIIYKAYKSAPVSEMPRAIKLTDSVLNTFAGSYKRPDGVAVTVTLKDNALVLKMSGIPDLNLIPQSEDRFYLLDLDAKIVFTKDDKGQVNAVAIEDGQNVIKCAKVYN
jgi:CubicO group peptidase (beta-lactamase class C family)